MLREKENPPEGFTLGRFEFGVAASFQAFVGVTDQSLLEYSYHERTTRPHILVSLSARAKEIKQKKAASNLFILISQRQAAMLVSNVRVAQ